MNQALYDDIERQLGIIAERMKNVDEHVNSGAFEFTNTGHWRFKSLIMERGFLKRNPESYSEHELAVLTRRHAECYNPALQLCAYVIPRIKYMSTRKEARRRFYAVIGSDWFDELWQGVGSLSYNDDSYTRLAIDEVAKYQPERGVKSMTANEYVHHVKCYLRRLRLLHKKEFKE